jgi:hypothetical protein
MSDSVRVYEPPDDPSTAPIEVVELPDGTKRQVVQALSGFVPEHYDGADFTYTSAGDVETVTYLLGQTQVGKILLTYALPGVLSSVRRTA